MKEISKSIVEQANAAHTEFIEIGGDVGQRIVDLVNKGREVGEYIRTLKSNDARWEQLTLLAPGHVPDEDEPCLQFGKEHAKTFMRLAEKMKEPASNPHEAMTVYKEVMMLQGSLDFPDGHGRQQLHDRDPGSIIIRHAMEIQATWNKDTRDLMPTWPSERRQHMRDQLKPIVLIYDALAVL